MPGTQALPRKRNKGSLSLYSDEEEQNDKYSGKSDELADSEADKELEEWVRERQQRDTVRRSPVRVAARARLPQLSSESDDNEMTY